MSSTIVLDKDITANLNGLLDDCKPGDELEMGMYNFNKVYLNLEKYMLLLKVFNIRAKHNKFVSEETRQLDITYTPKEKLTDSKINNKSTSSYRITLDGEETINNVIENMHKSRSHVIFSSLITKMNNDKNKNITAMKKSRYVDKNVDISDYNIRARLAKEEQLTKKEITDLSRLEHTNDDILFRLKQRISYFVDKKDNDNYIRVDITLVRSSYKINNLRDSISNYEVEIEFMHTDSKYKTNKIIPTMLKEAGIILKTIQQSNYIVSNSEQKQVINE